MTTNSSSLHHSLSELFATEKKVHALHVSLLEEGGTPALLDLLDTAIQETKKLDSEDDRSARFVRIALLLGSLEGDRVVDLLIDVLGSEEEAARQAAGESLSELAFERFKEVALGAERALTRLAVGHLALRELPYILGAVDEPGVGKLLRLWLGHKDPEAVAAAMEIMVEMGDPSCPEALAFLENDRRTVEVEGDESENTSLVTIGELAKEARTLFQKQKQLVN